MSLDSMKQRLIFKGGDWDGLNVKGKYRSFRSALRNSYQGEWITLDKIPDEDKRKVRCLLNPSKNTDDNTSFTISIDFLENMNVGDTFYWERVKKHFLVSLQEYSEEAYFRAHCDICDYQIEIENKKYWVYLRGPIETSDQWSNSHNIMINALNKTLYIKITKDENVLNWVDRFKKIKFDGHNWKLVNDDRYSIDGIVQLYFDEDFDNDMEDAMVIPEVTAAIDPDELEPDETTGQLPAYITGPQVVNPFDESITYEINNANSGKFSIDSNLIEIVSQTDLEIVINITSSRKGGFDIVYTRLDGEKITYHVNINSF